MLDFIQATGGGGGGVTTSHLIFLSDQQMMMMIMMTMTTKLSKRHLQRQPQRQKKYIFIFWGQGSLNFK